ncbi:hypothetical protein HK098_006730 [Nowakowskiella sp. JEL0407]|nr:hypothetical protein HK098_006730 [Nowakowskiella sp. JEL0407]
MKTFLLLVLLAPHISAASQRQNQNSSFVYALAKSFLWQRTIPVIPHDLILSTPVPTNVNYSNVVRGRDCNPCANTGAISVVKEKVTFAHKEVFVEMGTIAKEFATRTLRMSVITVVFLAGTFAVSITGLTVQHNHDVLALKSIVIGGLAFCIIVSSLYCLCYGKLKMRNAAPSTSIPTTGIIPPVPTDPKSPMVGNPHPYPPPMFESTTIDSIQNTARIPASGHDLENPLLAKQTSKVPSHEAKRDSEDATGESELIINVTSTSEAKMK